MTRLNNNLNDMYERMYTSIKSVPHGAPSKYAHGKSMGNSYIVQGYWYFPTHPITTVVFYFDNDKSTSKYFILDGNVNMEGFYVTIMLPKRPKNVTVEATINYTKPLNDSIPITWKQ